jgi:hypothetical protein
LQTCAARGRPARRWSAAPSSTATTHSTASAVATATYGDLVTGAGDAAVGSRPSRCAAPTSRRSGRRTSRARPARLLGGAARTRRAGTTRRSRSASAIKADPGLELPARPTCPTRQSGSERAPGVRSDARVRQSGRRHWQPRRSSARVKGNNGRSARLRADPEVRRLRSTRRGVGPPRPRALRSGHPLATAGG